MKEIEIPSQIRIDCFNPYCCALIKKAHGTVDSNTTIGIVDQQRFELYFEKTLVHLITHYNEGKSCSILVINHVTIHQHTREKIEHPEVGGKIIFTAS